MFVTHQIMIGNSINYVQMTKLLFHYNYIQFYIKKVLLINIFTNYEDYKKINFN